MAKNNASFFTRQYVAAGSAAELGEVSVAGESAAAAGSGAAAEA